jgi:hypothetical protein
MGYAATQSKEHANVANTTSLKTSCQDVVSLTHPGVERVTTSETHQTFHAGLA